MSDGTWDADYSRGDLIRLEIEQFCETNKIPCPKLPHNLTRMRAEEVLSDLKEWYEIREDVSMNIYALEGHKVIVTDDSSTADKQVYYNRQYTGV